MTDVYIVGTGMTPFGVHMDKSIKDLTRIATDDALKDAGCQREQVQAAYFGNCTQGYFDGQHMIRGNVCLLELGFQGIPIYTVESACATASMAFNLGVQTLQAGNADLVMAVGVEKMVYPDKAKMFNAFDSAIDLERVEWQHGINNGMGDSVVIPEGSESDKPYSPFMKHYASMCRSHMELHGTTQAQIAAISAKNHSYSVHNPKAQIRKPFTVEEVITAAPITYPLTLPMCSPISDGAAAVILCTKDALEKYGFSKSRAVRVAATELLSATSRDVSDAENHIVRKLADKVYQASGFSPEDIDVAELHDATAMGELLQSENLGFCEPGEGGPLVESGATSLGGKIPINLSGGLQSKGHPIGATGLGQIYSLVQQLRGESGAVQVEDARVGLQQNAGGAWGPEEASAHIAILVKD